MKIHFVEEKNSPLLGRKDIFFEIEDCMTVPSRIEVVKQITAQKGADEELTVLHRLSHRFGDKKVVGMAKIYASKEAMDKIESTHIQYRHLAKADKKKKYEEKKAANAAGKGKPTK